jgi:hypothetical protein
MSPAAEAHRLNIRIGDPFRRNSINPALSAAP